MPAKPSYNRKNSFGYCFILIAAFLLTGGYLLAAEKGTIPVEPRYRIFALKHISVEQAKTFIADARLGTASQLPAANMILLTAQPRQLRKAGAILQLVDSQTPYIMKAILPASAAPNLPLTEQIEAEVDNMSIGSFSNPRSDVGKTKAIIDVHEDSVVVISPADQLDKIIDAIKKYDSKGVFGQLQKVEPIPSEQPQKTLDKSQKPKPEADRIADAKLERLQRELEKLKTKIDNGDLSSKTSKAETDVEQKALFGKLLNGLAEADKKEVEPAQPSLSEPEPNEPVVQPGEPVTSPRKSTTTEPSSDVKPTEETTLEAAKPSDKPDQAAIVKRRAAEKIVAKAKPEPDASLEQVVANIEDANQVAAFEQEEPNTTTKVFEPTTKSRPYQPELSKIVDDTLELDLPSKINIIDLLDLVGKYLNLNYMYDPADTAGLKGEVTLVLQGPIKVKDLYLLAESVLRFKGFVMTRRINHITIVPIAKIASIDAPIVDPNKPGIQAGDVIITKIFRLKHIDTASAQNLLTGMKLGISFSPVAEMKTLIISEYAYRMERIERLIEMVDKPGEKKQFRFRALEYTTAGTLATKVKALAEQLGTVSITVAATTTTTARRTIPTRPGTRTTAPPRTTTRPVAPTAKTAQPTVYLDADERTNRILMIGIEEQLAVVDSLIDALDVEQQDLRTLRLYEIQHVDAEEVRTKLEELGIISAGRGVSGRTAARTIPSTRTTSSPRTAPSTRSTSTTAAIEEPLAEEAQVVIIEPTNSLLVNATAEQHVQIAMIIGYVDSTQEETANPYVIYPLENQDPEELAGVLEKLISETITEQGGADSKVVRTTTRKKIEEDIFIVPDPKSYSLIVYASKKNQQWISSLIEELDQYRPQVLLDVTLVEITKSDEFNYDLNFISSIPDLVNTSGLTGVIAGGDSPITSTDILGKLDSKGMNRFIDMQSSGGTGTAFYGDRHINILLNTMQSKDYGRILARPKLLVNDNEEGSIKAQETTSVGSPKTTYRKGSVGEQGNVGDIPITDIGWASYEAGIQLDIQPHISKGDQLRLTITLTRTDFRLRPATTISGSTYPTPPDLLTSDVQTVVTVPDSKTIILGGLERISQNKGGSKVPILGDIPLVGGLFRNAANTDSQSRLYVFVKAHILRPGEEKTGVSDLQVVSLKNRATFEKYEKEMQEYEDWPGIKPTPMAPERVLEADEDEVVSLNGQRIIGNYKKGAKEVEIQPGKKTQSTEPKQVLERNGTISLKNRQGFNEPKKEAQEYVVTSDIKSEPMHPMELLEPN